MQEAPDITEDDASEPYRKRPWPSRASKVGFRPMTEPEKRDVVRLQDLTRLSLRERRFTNDLASELQHAVPHISSRQAVFLRRLVYKYRRKLK